MSSSLKHLLILVGILCLSLSFSVKGVYILLSLEWGGSLFFFRAYIYTFNSVFIKKISTFVRHFIITARLLLNWKKDTNKEFNCVMVLVMWLRSTLKFLFVFDFNYPMDTSSSIRHRFDVEIPRGKFVEITSILKGESMWKLWHRFDVDISTWIWLSKSTKYWWVLHVDFSMLFRRQIDVNFSTRCFHSIIF